MVKNALDEIGLDDDFINDGDIEYYGSTMVICIIVGILQIKMVGRGGGKNVSNRNKGGNGIRYGNFGERLPKTLNLVQDDCDDTLAQNFSRNGHTQPGEDNFHSSGNQFENESEGNCSPNIQASGELGKRKRMTKLSGRINMALEATQAMDPPIRREEEILRNQGPRNQGSGHSIANGDNGHNGEATSKAKQRGERGKYKSYIADMKLKGRQSKLKVYIPDDIDRAIGDNARHFVNECGRVVRIRAPLNVKNWKEAFTVAGDAMWKEIEGKFEIKEGGSYMKLQAFAVDNMQQIYRLWKARLHYYYKERFGSTEFKKISERNSKNRLSEKRTKTTTGNLSFAEVEEILTQENKGVKPPADVIWLVEHTTQNTEGVLQWADESRSKEIHEQLKIAVAIHGDSMTQEEILLDVLKPRSGYFHGKGTTLRGYSKGRMQLEHQNLINKQQKQIQVQEQSIKELQETREKTTKQLQEAEERTSKQLEQQREDMQRSMEEMKQQLLSELIANRVLISERGKLSTLPSFGRRGAVRVGAGVGRGCRGGYKAVGWQGASGGEKGLNGWGAGAIDGLLLQGRGGAIGVLL
ncbi:ATP synthase subunit b [Bienertia sinuspersici]